MPKNQTSAADLAKLRTLAATKPGRRHRALQAPATDTVKLAAMEPDYAEQARLEVNTRRKNLFRIRDRLLVEREQIDGKIADIDEALMIYSTPAASQAVPQLRIVGNVLAALPGGEG